ncbi:MAG TPA: CvpA family protein [Candidatus Marinimicrobia bacterium]|nr:CvpA family protein [Candidatus Neomarinimicrobiota bacterium]|tara:strand:+ start:3389 stop:3874 length:486 start_codon:yes stop_codon:yes gene_type:complete
MIIDILFSLLIVFNAVLGVRKGLFDAVFEFIDIGVGIFFALSFYIDLTILLSSFLPIGTGWILLISGIIIFFLSIMISRFITSLLLFLFRGSNSFVLLDKIAGFIFGGLKTVVLLTIFIWFFDAFISSKIYTLLYNESQILVLLEPFKDYISQSMSSSMPI